MKVVNINFCTGLNKEEKRLLENLRCCLKYATDSEYREKRLEYQKDYNKRPGQKVKKREYNITYTLRPGQKEKNREYQNNYNKRPGQKKPRIPK